MKDNCNQNAKIEWFIRIMKKEFADSITKEMMKKALRRS